MAVCLLRFHAGELSCSLLYLQILIAVSNALRFLVFKPPWGNFRKFGLFVTVVAGGGGGYHVLVLAWEYPCPRYPLGKDLGSETWDQWTGVPPLPFLPRWQTHTCENSIFPILRMRAVRLNLVALWTQVVFKSNYWLAAMAFHAIIQYLFKTGGPRYVESF